MKATLAVINQMQADGVISRYAIGGAVAATFYSSPPPRWTLTFSSPSRLATPVPAHFGTDLRVSRLPWLSDQREYVIIEGWQVQFLPPGDALGEEALAQASETRVDDVPTWVMTAEHLVALALQLGRPKDFTRILQFIEAGVLDPDKLTKSWPGMGCLPSGRNSAISSCGTYERLDAPSLESKRETRKRLAALPFSRSSSFWKGSVTAAS